MQPLVKANNHVLTIHIWTYENSFLKIFYLYKLQNMPLYVSRYVCVFHLLKITIFFKDTILTLIVLRHA